MIKDIRYSGLTAIPSDYECPDGTLSLSLGILCENGSLRPLFPPKVLLTLEAGSQVLFIHKTSAYQHYIIKTSNGSLKWMLPSGGEPTDLRPVTVDKISHVDAIGNTLMVFTESAIIYYLWKDGGYKELGDSLPDLQISFGLIGRPRLYSVSDDSNSTFTISFDEIAENDIDAPFSEVNRSRITSQVMAKVNKFIAQQTVGKGRFCFPFLVRYALRLYDGTLTCHSAPILMNPSTNTCPIVMWNHVTGNGSYTDADLDIMLVAATLDYQVINDSELAHIDDWSDIVKGVEIYISKPIYTFDQSGECSSFIDSDNFKTKFIGRLYNKPAHPGNDPFATSVEEDRMLGPFAQGQTLDFLTFYSEWEYSKIYALYFSPDRTYPSKTLHLPEFSDDKVAETIRNTSTFYKLHTIAIPDLKTSASMRKEIVVDDEYLQSLVARETMTDDYLSHDKLTASQSFAYNSRMNLSGVKRKLFDGFYLASMLAYKNVDYDWSGNKDNTTLKITDADLATHNYTVTIFIKENNHDYAVSSQLLGLAMGSLGRLFSEEVTYTNLVTGHVGTSTETHSWGCYFFYPNVNAYRMVIQDSALIPDGNGSHKQPRLVIDLQPHDFLNGAFALLDYERVVLDNYDPAKIPAIPLIPSSGQNMVDVPNKIYTSEVNNPFFFPVTGINTVGTGHIRGLSSAAKALSQGQFGQFPLYAFTDEGVWALEVSATGTYSARQPITRDIILAGTRPLQLDSAVLFATDRGIMLLSGSQTQCISEILDDTHSAEGDSPKSLPGMTKLHAMLGHDTDTCLPTVSSLEFISECGMLYDYVHQRVIVYNSNYTYAYVYSLKSKEWGMMFSTIEASINSYPEALAMGHDGALLNFSSMEGEPTKGLMVTRPLKLEMPDILKTMDTIIQRGHFQKGHVQSVLYGSRDLSNWHLVWSSKDHYLRGFRGTPYKYFRIACVTSLSEEESIFGASLQFTPRLTDTPR